MLENYNRYKLLKIFLDSPTDSFRLRELSRIAKISPPSVMAYINEFKAMELIRSYKKREIPYYKAERDNEDFIFYKKLSIQYELHKSGLIDFLWNKLAPKAIILYGSHAKGESIEISDIDIYIIGKEKELNLKGYENKLGKEIHLMFKEDIKKVNKNLRNNLINGIVIKGFLKAF